MSGCSGSRSSSSSPSGMAVTVALIAVPGARRRGPSGWRSVSPSSAAGRWGGLGSFSPFSFRCADPRSPRAGWLSGPSSSRTGSLAMYDPTYGRPSRRRPIASHDSVTCFPSTTRRWSRRPCSTSRAPPAASGSRSSRRAFCSHWWVTLVGVVDSITGIAPAPGDLLRLASRPLGLYDLQLADAVRLARGLSHFYPSRSGRLPGEANRVRPGRCADGRGALPRGRRICFDATLRRCITVRAVLLAGYALYYYGLTVYIAFDPNQFLFDAVRFMTFTVGVAVALVRRWSPGSSSSRRHWNSPPSSNRRTRPPGSSGSCSRVAPGRAGTRDTGQKIVGTETLRPRLELVRRGAVSYRSIHRCFSTRA